MLHITNRKVAGFNTQWASFHGFSILFNNLGDKCLQSRRPGMLDLVNDVNDNPALKFYAILHEGITRLNTNFLTNQFLFCALPPSTYHVTLWGGLNDRHVTKIEPQYRSIVEKWLLDLPESFCNTPKSIFDLPATSPLCLKRDWNINFCFDGLKVWNNSVLVAALRPDENSISVFEQLSEERSQLNEKVHDRLNIDTDTKAYTPHVSLGYFANEEGAQRASHFVDEWNQWFSNACQDNLLSFNNADIYGLTDMVTFFKAVDN
ncbi:unnamed protein product [Adineta steineri]|uniref:DUF1868 domain-containing protein n=1 Tax=Adineta steineri TaxID=433720 RepID=A0A813TL66_9BILA|nr:unnamed protein product [Adineta steineri]CAF3975977.1 unnamed protein product [Adineta steineri]